MGKMHAEGVTLIELLVVVAVLATVLSLGTAAFTEIIAANRMAATVNDVMAALHLGRSEAIKRRGTVTLCASDNALSDNPRCAASGGLDQGWLLFVEDEAGPADARLAPGERVIAAGGPAPAGIAGNSSFANGGAGDPCYVSFDAEGRLADLFAPPSANLTDLQFCDRRGDTDTGGGIAAGRWIRLSANGRVQLVRERAELQGPSNPLGGCS